MSDDIPGTIRSVIAMDQLPPFFPTQRHPAQFWEHLGRAIATFGFLEEVLGKAIFAFTATRQYESTEEAKAAYEKWLPQLQQALSGQLGKLAETYLIAVRNNKGSTISNVDELVNDIKKVTTLRNVLSHGSWRSPDNAGKSLPLFVNRNNEKFDTPIDLEFLRSIQRHTTELACAVINSVTHMGWQFPGGAGLGKTIWQKN